VLGEDLGERAAARSPFFVYVLPISGNSRLFRVTFSIERGFAMCAMKIRQKMVERTERISNAMRRVAEPVEKPQFVICCGSVGGGMRSTKFSIRAARRVGRF